MGLAHRKCFPRPAILWLGCRGSPLPGVAWAVGRIAADPTGQATPFSGNSILAPVLTNVTAAPSSHVWLSTRGMMTSGIFFL